MENIVCIKDLAQSEGQKISLQGWVCHFRSSGKISFMVLRDGTGECQCVLSERDMDKESTELLSKLALETSVQILGIVKKWKQTFEISAYNLRILSESKNYPIAKKSHGSGFFF